MGLEDFITDSAVQDKSDSDVSTDQDGYQLHKIDRDVDKALKCIVAISNRHGEVTNSKIRECDEAPVPGTYRNRYGSIAQAKLDAGLEVENAVKCLDCNCHYGSISKHWAQSSCSQNVVSDKQKEILKGHLMGDATLVNRDYSSPHMKWVMNNESYMEWIDVQLGWLSNGHSLKLTSEEASAKLDQGIFSAGSSHDAKALFKGTTCGHEWLNNLNWYKSGEKIFPEDLKLTRTAVKVWYCDDGGLKWSEGASNALAHIHISSQPQALEHLKTEFKRHGIGCTIRSNNDGLTFPVEETQKLLNWMGEPPKGMEYKWQNTSKAQYNELKPQ